MQQQYRGRKAEQLALFESKAAHYRKLTINPQVSEEQGKTIVQASALNQGDPVNLNQTAFRQGDWIMYPIKLRFSLAVLMPTVFIGCATPGPVAGTSPIGSLRPGFDVAYYPQIQPGATVDSARKEWIDLFPATAFFNNRLEMVLSEKIVTLYYYQLLNRKIAVEAKKSTRGGYERGYHIQFPDWGLHFTDLSKANRTADALLVFQHQVKKFEEELNAKLGRFEPIASQYRALTSKPAISEEQRRLIVQANTLSQQKKYEQALEQYLKAIEIDATAYSAAYFNLALLYAQTNTPVSAITYMKHYLLLEPQAKDARGAQDKIYEWEFLIGKQ